MRFARRPGLVAASPGVVRSARLGRGDMDISSGWPAEDRALGASETESLQSYRPRHAAPPYWRVLTSRPSKAGRQATDQRRKSVPAKSQPGGLTHEVDSACVSWLP